MNEIYDCAKESVCKRLYGKLCAHLQRFHLCLRKRRIGEENLVCSERSSKLCKGFCHISDSKFISHSENHNHIPNPTKKVVQCLLWLKITKIVKSLTKSK